MPKHIPMTKQQCINRFFTLHPNCEAYMDIRHGSLIVDGALNAEELFTLFLTFTMYCQENEACPTP